VKPVCQPIWPKEFSELAMVLGILRDTEFEILTEGLVELVEISAILPKGSMYFFMMFLCMT
jgi:hypothetical protein